MAAAPQAQQKARVAATEVAVSAGAANAADAGGGAIGALSASTVKLLAASILSALVAFLAALRQRQQAWLTREVGRYSRDPHDVAVAMQVEQTLSEVFARNSADRVAKALPAALAISDPVRREAAVRQILADEERFARQHSEASAARALAAVDRSALRRESPLGAFWKLGVASNHTEGCLKMGERFWPWAVLDRLHPPRHYGCVSRLVGFGEALQAGWMTAGDVPDTREAVRRAAGVLMEGEADALLRELDVRDRLVEVGVDRVALAGVEFHGVRGGR